MPLNFVCPHSNILIYLYAPIQICNRYSVFLREYAHIFPPPGGNLKIRGNIKIPEGEARGNFNIPEDFQIPDGQGNIWAYSRKKTEYLLNFFYRLPHTKHINHKSYTSYYPNINTNNCPTLIWMSTFNSYAV